MFHHVLRALLKRLYKSSRRTEPKKEFSVSNGFVYMRCVLSLVTSHWKYLIKRRPKKKIILSFFRFDSFFSFAFLFEEISSFSYSIHFISFFSLSYIVLCVNSCSRHLFRKSEWSHQDVECFYFHFLKIILYFVFNLVLHSFMESFSTNYFYENKNKTQKN